jgi:hypothetical protein
MFEFEEREEQKPEEKKRRRKPRQPAEVLDTPRRWLIGDTSRTSVIESDSKPNHVNSAYVRLMGTHESQEHAEKRMGWS